MLLEELFYDFLFAPYKLLLPIILILVIIFSIIFIKEYRGYKNGAYYKVTKLPYFTVKQDKGKYGEYLTYKNLKKFEANGAKFLFNTYIPKADADGETSEIDVLMICSKGLFVFESKNYSGWIFGGENQKNWYQTLPTGRGRSHKEHFYNPIMQNRSHIKYLKAFLGEQIPMHSVIVFSDRCTLKNIQIKNNDIYVVNRFNVASVVSTICNKTSSDLLCVNKINNLYNKLYPYTQVDAVAKQQHIANIHSRLTTPSVQPTVTDITSISFHEPNESVASTNKIEQTAHSSTNVDELIYDIVESISNTKSDEQIIDNPLVFKCPKCGGNLVLRTASKGNNAGKRFYGCSNYPKCRYIQNVI